jgi:AhpD family alkylhydroperoxidase
LKPRIDIEGRMPEAYKRMVALDASSKQRLEAPLRELVKIRASQLNGCAYCIDMHTKDARAGGEDEQRIYALNAWRETPFFSERERAALGLAEAVTLVADGHVPDEVWEPAARQFDEAELAELLWAIVVINAWNRLGVASRAWTPGTYEAPAPRAGAAG